MRYAVILAGGRGTRFWPVSRKTDPKQLIPLLDGKTLLEATVERIAPLFPPERIVVAVTEQLAPKVAQALPRLPAENLVVEPAGRNTAPCIALAAREIGRRDRRATMAVFPADHYIPDQEAFLPILEAALRVAEEEGVLVTFGIRPDRPHTGYGYIERGEEVRRVRGVPIHRVRSFREKPNRAVAQRYLEAGNYAWNGGIFVWRTDIIEEEIATFLPDVAQGLRDIDGVSDSEERGRRLAEVYPTFPNISIDYAILEKSDRIVMVEIDTRWSDVGAWAALPTLLGRDEAGNTVRARRLVCRDAHDLLVHAPGKVVAVIGASNLIVVDTPDALLICDVERSEEVKAIVESLKGSAEEDVL